MRWFWVQFFALEMTIASAYALEAEDLIDLQVIEYDLLIQEDPKTLQNLKNALYQDGIVGLRGVPTFQEKLLRFVNKARAFSALPEEIKERYAPNRERGDLFLGYEKGKEKFKRPDGSWVTDDLKVSYYVFIPERPENRWPVEIDLQSSYMELGSLMVEMGKVIMAKIDLTGPSTGIFMGDAPQVGRMLHYIKSQDTSADNPYWCGAHFDHGLFTALAPALYFAEEKEVSEPEEAGLFVKSQGTVRKVPSDPKVMMFQVGEFGQLVMNDAIKATEHRVHKANGVIERYTMAVFFEPPLETTIYSTSILTQDSRYGTKPSCTYQRWHEESFKRYIVED